MPVEEKTDQRETDEKVVEIELERLRTFTNHPFKVQADSQMIELQDSIRKYGILNPLIVRPRPEGVYEIISGHRRKFAAEKLGYRKVPVIIRAMKYDAIKRKTGRRKCGQVDHHSGKKTLEVIGEEGGDSPKQVQRYIKITELIPELLEKVDDGSMGFTPAVQISYLKKKEQEEMLEAMDFAQCTPSLSQAIRIKKLSVEGKLTIETMEDILSEIKQKDIDRVVFKNEQLHRFFPASYTSEQMRREILEILKLWMKNNWDLTNDEIGKIIIVEAENETDQCYEYIVKRILAYREYGDEILDKDYFIKYAPSSGRVNPDHPFSHLTDTANTLVNWLDYTQFIYREETKEKVKEILLKDTDVNGIVQVCSFVIAEKDIEKYTNESFAADYRGWKFNIEKGCILAIGNQYNVRINKVRDDLANTSSIFSIVPNTDQTESNVLVDLGQQKIVITLPEKTYQQYYNVQGYIDIQPVMHSMIIVPALVYAFSELRITDDLEGMEYYRWFRALKRACDGIGVNLDAEGLKTMDSFKVAQQLLNGPIAKAIEYSAMGGGIYED